MNPAVKSGLLVLLGGLTVLVSNGVAERLHQSKMGCNTRLALLADEVKPMFVLPIKDTNDEAVLAMVGQEKSVLITLTLTEGNFLLESQCVRPDGKKVLMTVEDHTVNK
jgi:hypothetical protein